MSSDAEKLEQWAGSRLAGYQQGRRFTRESHLPGRPAAVFRWRILSAAEKQICLASARARFRELELEPELEGYLDYHQEITYQVLALALRDPSDEGTPAQPYPRPLAASVGELRELLPATVADELGARYYDFEAEVLGEDDDDDLSPPERAAIDAAVKKKDARSLNNFEPHTLRTWLLTTDLQPST
jgi:hypothetical protein